MKSAMDIDRDDTRAHFEKEWQPGPKVSVRGIVGMTEWKAKRNGDFRAKCQSGCSFLAAVVVVQCPNIH